MGRCDIISTIHMWDNYFLFLPPVRTIYEKIRQEENWEEQTALQVGRPKTWHTIRAEKYQSSELSMAVVTRYHHQISCLRVNCHRRGVRTSKEKERGEEWTGCCRPLPSLDMSTCHFSFSFSSNTICLSISLCQWLLEKGALFLPSGNEGDCLKTREHRNMCPNKAQRDEI